MASVLGWAPGRAGTTHSHARDRHTPPSAAGKMMVGKMMVRRPKDMGRVFLCLRQASYGSAFCGERSPGLPLLRPQGDMGMPFG